MAKPTPRHPHVPQFDNALLDQIGVALGQRIKPMRKAAVATLVVARDLGDHGERLTLDLVTRVGRCQVRLRVWTDAHLFLGLHEPAPGRNAGWAFAYTARGDVSALSATRLVAKLERTLAMTHRTSRKPETKNLITELWQDAALVPE